MVAVLAISLGATLTSRIDAVEANLTARIDALSARIDAQSRW